MVSRNAFGVRPRTDDSRNKESGVRTSKLGIAEAVAEILLENAGARAHWTKMVDAFFSEFDGVDNPTTIFDSYEPIVATRDLRALYSLLAVNHDEMLYIDVIMAPTIKKNYVKVYFSLVRALHTQRKRILKLAFNIVKRDLESIQEIGHGDGQDGGIRHDVQCPESSSQLRRKNNDYWSCPKSHVGSTDLKKDGILVPRPTVQGWVNHDLNSGQLRESEIVKHPVTGKHYYPRKWANGRLAKYRPKE
jgi:hypothetical protein